MHRRFFRYATRWGPAILQAVAIFFFSHQPAGSEVLRYFPLSATLGHLAGYGLLALLIYRGLCGGWSRWYLKAAVWTLLISALYGVSDELHQGFVPGREPSVVDVIINGAGAMLALGAVRIYAATGPLFFSRLLRRLSSLCHNISGNKGS